MDIRTYSFTGGAWSSEPDAVLDSDRTLVMMFGASELVDNPAPIERVIEAFPRSTVMGCSTSGEIHGTRIHDDSLVVAVAKFERTTLRLACAPIDSVDTSCATGADIARRLDGEDLRAVLLLSDGLAVNGSELVRGVNGVLPPSVAFTGGLAGDGARFARTWIIADRRPAPGYVAAVGLYGDAVQVGHGSKGGFDAFGVERRVTRARGKVLYELDGKPALEVYKQYLGERAAALPASGLHFPFTVRADGNDDKRLVRTILAVDEDSQSLTFAGDMPEGSYAQLMHSNFDRLIQGAGEAAVSSRPGTAPGQAALAIAVSCVGRRLVLGERTEEEIEATLEALPPATEQIGFYSYGEISPFASGHSDLHNQTMTLTTICEM
jgi:hypothetical protein